MQPALADLTRARKVLLSPADARPHIRIQPASGWTSLGLRELWNYHELLFYLIWRDIKVRYKQTALGATWAIIQPFFTMVVFSLFFGHLAKVPSDGVPYPLFSYAGLVPWTFFANGLSQSSNSLVESANLVKKIYFPRLSLPIATVLSGLVDLALALVMLLILMFAYGTYPTIRIVWLPAFLLLSITTALGVGFWISALNVKYRDFRYIVPFLTQIWLFMTPVPYSSSLLPEPWRTLYGLNPMAGVVEGFRWALLGLDTAPGALTLVSAGASATLLIGGAFYFRRVEKTFADLV
jgi:lipopolysaccharide transport system permease protein